MPTVSIITPLFNCESFIGETIESVQRQTFTDWEMIIANDCSTDNSREVVKKYIKDDPRIILIESEKNGGTSVARNKGLNVAKGRYISFLDSDDWLHPDYLEKQLAFLKEKDAAIATASYMRVAKKTTTPFIVPKESTFNTIIKGNGISCLTTLYDREKVGEERFLEEFRKCEDLVFWCTILKKVGVCYGNPEVLADYRIYEGSKSRQKIHLVKHQWKVYRKALHFNIFKAFYCLCRWAIYGLKKYSNVR